MRKYHPDHHSGSPEKQKTATELTQKLTEAYKLSNADCAEEGVLRLLDFSSNDFDHLHDEIAPQRFWTPRARTGFGNGKGSIPAGSNPFFLSEPLCPLCSLWLTS